MKDDLELSNHIEEAMYGRVGTSDCHKVGMWGDTESQHAICAQIEDLERDPHSTKVRETV